MGSGRLNGRPCSGVLRSLSARDTGVRFENHVDTDVRPVVTTSDAFAHLPVTARLAFVMRGENVGGAGAATGNQSIPSISLRREHCGPVLRSGFEQRPALEGGGLGDWAPSHPGTRRFSRAEYADMKDARGGEASYWQRPARSLDPATLYGNCFRAPRRKGI